MKDWNTQNHSFSPDWEKVADFFENKNDDKEYAGWAVNTYVSAILNKHYFKKVTTYGKDFINSCQTYIWICLSNNYKPEFRGRLIGYIKTATNTYAWTYNHTTLNDDALLQRTQFTVSYNTTVGDGEHEICDYFPEDMSFFYVKTNDKDIIGAISYANSCKDEMLKTIVKRDARAKAAIVFDKAIASLHKIFRDEIRYVDSKIVHNIFGKTHGTQQASCHKIKVFIIKKMKFFLEK